MGNFLELFKFFQNLGLPLVSSIFFVITAIAFIIIFRKMSGFENKLDKFSATLHILVGKIDMLTSINNGVMRSNSPVTLTKKGKIISENIKAKNILEIYRGDFFDNVMSECDYKTAYDI